MTSRCSGPTTIGATSAACRPPTNANAAGGAGVYYHFDYHGGPRSYQWLNTSPISKIWDQMSLAGQYGADRIWIVNVGHFKGYEFPLEYFLDLAWDTDRWIQDNFDEFTQQWAEREFGPAYARDIADIVAKYTKYNGRRKPELLAPDTYSLVDYQEAENVVADFKAITAKAEKIYSQLPEAKRDAFYELVLFPTKASALVNELYLAAAAERLVRPTGPGQRQRHGGGNPRAFSGGHKFDELFQPDVCPAANGTISWTSRTSAIPLGRPAAK